MLLKNSQILASESALSKLLNTPLPAKQAYNIKKTMKSIQEKLKDVLETRNEIIKKYGIEKEDGSVEIPAEDVEAKKKFIEEYQQIINLEEDVDVRQLSIDELENIELTANEIETIDFLISEE